MRSDAFATGAPAAAQPATAPAPNTATASPTPAAPPPQPAGAPLANASPPPSAPAPATTAPATTAPATTAPATNAPAATPPASPPAAKAGKAGKGKEEFKEMSAAEIAGQQRPAPQEGDNSAAHDEALTALMSTVDDLGRIAGQGANSLGDLAIAVCAAARAGTIRVDAKSEDVATIYRRYAEAQASVRKDDKDDKDAPKLEDKDIKTHVSRLRKFAQLGAADWKGNDAASRLAKARDFLNTIPRTLTGRSVYSSLYMVATAQLKAIDAKTGKGKALTQDEMRRVVIKEGGADDERTTAEIVRDELAKIVKAIAKVTGGTDERAGWDAPELTRAYEILNAYQTGLAKKISDENKEGEPEAASESEGAAA